MVLKVFQTLAVLCFLFKCGRFEFPCFLLDIPCKSPDDAKFDLRGQYIGQDCWGYILCENDGSKTVKKCPSDEVFNNSTKLCEKPTLEMNACNKVVLCNKKADGFYDRIEDGQSYQIQCKDKQYVKLIDCSKESCIDLDDENLG